MGYDMVDFCIGYVIGKTDFSKEHDLFDCYQMFFALKEYLNNHIERTADYEDEDEVIDFLFNLDLEKTWNDFEAHN